MPLHLELGSDGHSFHGKAIVVNTVTGKHYSHAPIPLKKAEAQKRVIEGAMEKHGEHVTATGKPAKRAHSPLKKKVSPDVAAERRARHEAKKMKPAAAKVAMLHEKMPEHEHDMSIAPLKAKKAEKGSLSFAEGKAAWDALEEKRKAIHNKWVALLMRKRNAIRGMGYDDKWMEEQGFFRMRDEEEPAVEKEQEEVLKRIDEATAPAYQPTPKVIKDLKVGGKIVAGKASGYMGDGGDSRDVGYQKTFKVVEHSKGVYTCDDVDNRKRKFKLTSDKTWLKSMDDKFLMVYSINGVGEKDDKHGFESAWNTFSGDREKLKKVIAAADKKTKKAPST